MLKNNTIQGEQTLRRSERSNKGVPPKNYIESANLIFEEDPKTRKEAIASENNKKRIEAMNEEISSLKNNNTWTLVDVPKNKNIVSCKWVFKTKRNLDGEVTKFKARLVARGFSQKYGTDYDQVFAPVVRHTTFHTLLTVAGMERMTTRHYDAKTAFLNGSLNEEIYMYQPEGFNINEKKLCKLNKSIYGLKQAAKSWNDTLNSILKDFDFIQSKTDPCLYTKIVKNELIYLIVYVDDFIISCRDVNLIKKTGDYFSKFFNLTDLGDLHHYLGIKIEKDEDGIYCLNQEQYIDNLLNRFGLKDAKISSIPLDQGYSKVRDASKKLPTENNYQQLIGGLLYVTVHTRPDINASVTILSQYNKNPTQVDLNEAKRVLRYLKGTKHLSLKLGNSNDRNLKIKNLYGYADADWAQEKSDRKSNSGNIFMFNGSPISWSCKKQVSVALSSTEAEYISLADASQEAIWLRRLLKDFNLVQSDSTVLFEDNQSCLKLVENNKFSNRTKHIDTKFHFVRELKENDIINYKYCQTEFMLADMLTKPLNKVKLKKMRERCNVINVFSRKGVEYI